MLQVLPKPHGNELWEIDTSLDEDEVPIIGIVVTIKKDDVSSVISLSKFIVSACIPPLGKF